MAKEALTPRESGRYISEHSKYVSINHSEISNSALKLQDLMTKKSYSFKQWKEWPLHPKTMEVETLYWILIVDTLNFSFWLPKQHSVFQVEYNGNVYEDYEALCACINRALEEKIAITTPAYCKSITLEKVKHIFRSSNGTVLPLIEERTSNLQEVGSVLCEGFNGKFDEMIETAGGDVKLLIDLVTTHFSCFNDVGVFDKQPVQFHKRVQILIADIWACFENTGYGEFKNIQELTMFPDYRVPQALLSLNVISYTDELMKRIEKEEILPHGEREEMEIRGCSIHAVELLCANINQLLLKEKKKPLNSVLIDFYLWDYATQNASKVERFPEHRTRSIYY